jgi:hypothetical protein
MRERLSLSLTLAFETRSPTSVAFIYVKRGETSAVSREMSRFSFSSSHFMLSKGLS